MLRKLFIAVLMVTASTNLAFAKNRVYKPAVNYPHVTRAYYKGEAPLLVCKAAQDNIPCMTYSFNSGFYLGLGPGIRSNYSIKSLANYKGLEGTLFGGYKLVRSKLYLAAEIFSQHGIQLQNYTNAVNLNGNPIGLRTSWGIGFSVLPGYIIADTLLGYLRLGVVNTHFQDVARTKTGGQVGFGLQGTVSETCDLRAEYVYSFYPSLPILGNPRSDQFHIGLIYKIDP